MSLQDSAGDVRQGEELDPAVIGQWLTQRVPGLTLPLSIHQFPGGASNLTYLLSFANREVVLRRPPFGHKAKSAHDMGREYRVMQGLRSVYPYVPEMLAFCENDSVIGSEFYVMERLNGVILRTNLPPDMSLSATDARQLCGNMVQRLVDLHQVDWEGTPLKELAREGDFVERQLSGWSDRFQKARTPDVPDYQAITQWLGANRPAQIRKCLVHNDYRFDNLVLDSANPMNIIGVLDWEMATIGDPLLDLGNSLAYWIEASDPAPLQLMRRQPTHLPGMMSRDELVACYLAKSGLQVDSFRFYEVFGVFRLVVILQQIYYRFYHGQTQDKRFAGFGQLVNFLEGYLQQRITR
jgi:aminoglycoside phosphotransferase (APT) family kinase protein